MLTRTLLAAVSLAVTAPTAPAKSAPRPLLVGTRAVAPLAIKNADGSWSGMSIELWQRVAADLGVPYTITEFEPDDLLAPERKGIDVVVSLPITARHDALMELSQAFHQTGLAIAIPAEPRSSWQTLLSAVGTRAFAQGLGLLAAVLLAMGCVVWLIERRAKPDEYGGHPVRGIAQGTFWAFESLFGKASGLSRSKSGRVVALAWAFLTLLVVSGLTAKLAAELTVSRLSSRISGPEDLPKLKVGTVKASTAEHYLQTHGVQSRDFPDIAAALTALDQGTLEAVVYEAPILQYEASHAFDGRLRVLPGTFQNHGYGFGFRRPSAALRDRVDLALLKIIETDDWRAVLTRYLGSARSL